MITLKENQLNTIAFQKETDTPLVTSSYDTGSVYNIILYPTIENNTELAGITYTTDFDESNPIWSTLKTNISSQSLYISNTIEGEAGTTYNLEIWYGPIITVNDFYWINNQNTWATETREWSTLTTGSISVDYNAVTSSGEFKYSDRVFISGSVHPFEKKYISSNEDGNYKYIYDETGSVGPEQKTYISPNEKATYIVYTG